MLRFTRTFLELSASTVTIRAASIPPPAGTVHSRRRASAAPGTSMGLLTTRVAPGRRTGISPSASITALFMSAL